jgi:hypothetical protein
VNLAALEALAEPGGICVSRIVRDQVRDRVDPTFEDLGEQRVKNITRGPNFSTHRRTVSYEMSSPRDRRHRVEPDPAVLAARYGLIRRFPTGTLARN